MFAPQKVYITFLKISALITIYVILIYIINTNVEIISLDITETWIEKSDDRSERLKEILNNKLNNKEDYDFNKHVTNKKCIFPGYLYFMFTTTPKETENVEMILAQYYNRGSYQDYKRCGALGFTQQNGS